MYGMGLCLHNFSKSLLSFIFGYIRLPNERPNLVKRWRTHSHMGGFKGLQKCVMSQMRIHVLIQLAGGREGEQTTVHKSLKLKGRAEVNRMSAGIWWFGQ